LVAEEEIVCPVKKDWLKNWSEQIPRPFWGKLAPYIEKCVLKEKEEKRE